MNELDDFIYTFLTPPRTEKELTEKLKVDELKYQRYGGNYLVVMHIKYEFEDEYREYVELLRHYPDEQYKWIWESDWYEGEQDIQFKGYVYLEELGEAILKIFDQQRR